MHFYFSPAPEVIKKQPYGKEMDWWCLGNLIFEMMTGLVCNAHAFVCVCMYDYHIAASFLGHWLVCEFVCECACVLACLRVCVCACVCLMDTHHFALLLQPPFYVHNSSNVNDMYDRILNGDLKFPPYISPVAQSMMHGVGYR